MNNIEAVHILKYNLNVDGESSAAYHIATTDTTYIDAITTFYEEIKSSISMGQSTISLGELVRQFYNATHRYINDTIIDLPGAEFCADIGQVASAAIQQISEINQMTEEYATAQISCNDTIDISYL